MQDSTIIALATPPGIGAISITRLSGPKALNIAEQMTKKNLKPRQATLSTIYNNYGKKIDYAICIFYKSPYSFTGEDIVELQTHGNNFISKKIISVALELGAEIAQPGEFSKRAFLNNKISLGQAEAVNDLIHASSELATKSALLSLSGEFEKLIKKFLTELTNIRIYLESSIDFSDEEIDTLEINNLFNKLEQIKITLADILCKSKTGSLLQKGINTLILGKPNVGKSSLLNLLSNEEKAIVSNISGTTRDVIENSIILGGFCINLIDTAGIREAKNEIERQGINKAKKLLSKADLVILMLDARETEKHLQKQNSNPKKGLMTNQDKIIKQLISLIKREFAFENKNLLIIHNKIDLLKKDLNVTERKENELNNYLNLQDNKFKTRHLFVTVKTNLAKEKITNCLLDLLEITEQSEGIMIARERHVAHIKKCVKHIEQAFSIINNKPALELIAEELRLAQHSLAQITGKFTADDLLGEIFKKFCIGK